MASRRVTMNDVARRAGVSKNAVSLALRHDVQIPLTTRLRIERIVREMGYRKNATVSHLMAQLSRSGTSENKPTLALLNANPDPKAFLRHPTLPVYVEGSRRRAEELGYAMEEFWLYDPRLSCEQLSKIFRTRGIRGAVVTGLTKTKHLPERFRALWDKYHAVVTGVRTQDPTLSFACTDHHMLAIRAFEQALLRGYKRPALVLDSNIDEVIDGRFTAGVQIAQQMLPRTQRVAPFYLVGPPQENEGPFRKWFESEKPDLVLTLYNVVHTWMKTMKLRIPDEVGLIQLEWRKPHPECAGMNQHNEVVGASAVEMLINMMHNHPPGLAQFPLATLIGSTWVDGKTVRKIKSAVAA